MATIENTRFGTIEIDDDQIISFVKPIKPFDESSRYVLIPAGMVSAWPWLQSMDEAHVAFPVVAPGTFFDGYELEISDSDADRLRVADDSELLVLSIVSVRPGGEATANLQAPVVINVAQRRALQAGNNLPAPLRAPLTSLTAEKLQAAAPAA